jgi:hypothetical protein
MMARAMTAFLIWMVAALPAFAGAIEVKVDIRSEVRGHVVDASPRVRVKDDHEATITIEGGDTKLNGTPLPGRVPAYQTRLTIRPRVEAGMPRILRVRLSLDLTHGGSTQRRSFDLAAVDGRPTVLEFDDPDRQEHTRLEVTAYVRD